MHQVVLPVPAGTTALKRWHSGFPRAPGGYTRTMSTGAIIAIVVAVILVIAVLIALVPRARERSRIREAQRDHRRAADARLAQADEHDRRAELAGATARRAQADAQRAEADAEIARAEADQHAAVADADPRDLRGREADALRYGRSARARHAPPRGRGRLGARRRR